MKVRCNKLLDAHGKEAGSSPWLKLGGIYDVLSISVGGSGAVLLRLLGEGTEPGLFPLAQFELVNESVPRNWVVKMMPSGGLAFAPKSWMAAGFWERFFDGDTEAKAIFEEERSKIESKMKD